MVALRLLEKASEKLAPGRSPSFNKAHVLKAIEVISEEGVGRKQLALRLALGEGMTRNLVSRLRDNGLLETSRQGMSLSCKGKQLLDELRQTMRSGEFPESSLTVAKENYVVLVKGCSGGVRYGLEQRDYALMAGAAGATTVIYDEKGLYMPGTEREIEPRIRDFILRELQPEHGDVMIIGSAESLHMAEMGAKAAALKLLT